MTKLTQAQIDEFRRHPGTFSEMVQAIYDAGAAAVKESLTPQPAWHDAPTQPGLWLNAISGRVNVVIAETLDAWQDSAARWYGPIPAMLPYPTNQPVKSHAAGQCGQ